MRLLKPNIIFGICHFCSIILRNIFNPKKEYVESMLAQYSESQSVRDINGDASLLCWFQRFISGPREPQLAIVKF